jgi:hypothetical protein
MDDGGDDGARERMFRILFMMIREHGGRMCALCGMSWREHVVHVYVWGLDSINHNFTDLM